VLIAERWIIARLRDRKFFSLAEANAAIAACTAEINARPFQKLDGSRQLLFEQVDRPELRPLPATRYEFATWRRATVNIDYHIAADRHYYSVPYQLARQQVAVRMSAATAEIFRNSRRVASHPRSPVRHGHTTHPAHMPESHRRHAEWTPSRITGEVTNRGPDGQRRPLRGLRTTRYENSGLGDRNHRNAHLPLIALGDGSRSCGRGLLAHFPEDCAREEGQPLRPARRS
jgi:hypothetical protein